MRSECTDKIAKALALSQTEIKKAVKAATNSYFKSDYASLEAVIDACLPALNKHEIGVSQETVTNWKFDEVRKTDVCYVVLKTVLYHSSGQWISSDYPLHPTKPDPQSLGSALSYARRYSLSAIACVGTSDEDGDHAMERVKPTQPKPVKEVLNEFAEKLDAAQSFDRPTPAQIKRFFAIMHSAHWTEAEVKQLMKNEYKKESTKDLTRNEYESICKTMIANPVEGNFSSEQPH